MTTQTKLENPYLDEFLNANLSSQAHFSPAFFMGLIKDGYTREDLVKKYAWAVPSQEAIESIAKLGPIVEIGAGKGYWASLISQIGGDIVCYDNGSRKYEAQYYPVKMGSPRSVRKHPDRHLMLCWPEYDTNQASHSLRLFIDYSTADHLAYIGEGYGGCTGNNHFHNLLDQYFNLAETIKIPQFWGINDQLFIFRKKQKEI